MLFKRVTKRNICIKYGFIFCVICIINCSLYVFKEASQDTKPPSSSSSSAHHLPSLPSVYQSYSSFSSRHLLSLRNCTPPAIDQFPRDIFSVGTRRQGVVVLHIFAAIYMFFGLALVCDEYFVPSCERFCNALGMSDDVAGATFMAAGSSAPELATAVIGVFVAKDDIGLGSVIGSAVFNIMLVISLCALFAGMVVQLKWWPMCRDCIFYLLSILVLVLVIMDERVYWYEALCMLFLYIFYIVLMFYNSRIEDRVTSYINSRFKRYQKCSDFVDKADDKEDDDVENNNVNNDDDNNTNNNISNSSSEGGGDDESNDVNENEASYLKVEKINMMQGKSSKNKNKKNKNNGNSNHRNNRNKAYDQLVLYSNLLSSDGEEVTDFERMCLEDNNDDKDIENNKNEDDDEDDDEFTSVWQFPKNNFKKIFWIVCIPLTTLMFITIPDCRNPRLKKCFALTFVMSCVWIAVYSYVMVWMITVVGYTFGVSDSVMGLTLIAAGSSVPDAIASLIVVRAGQGDMAVSNAIGSNIFDIFVCLGVPWLLQTTINKPLSSVTVYSAGLTYTALTLLGTVFILLILTHLNHWKLTKPYGVVLLFFYIFFVVFASLFELNVFGYLNPPNCVSIYDI